MSVTVRPVTTKDRAAWSRLWDDYLAFYETARDPAQHDQTWARIMDANQPLWAMVAETDSGEIVGIVNYLFHAGFWDAEDVCYLSDLYVSSAARGLGTGEALIASLEAEAKAHQVAELYWLTAEDNTTARGLYDRVATRSGFIHYVKE